MELFQQIVLGIIQGITEWIPVSSEGFLLFFITNFFGGIEVDLFLRQALFLHLGTFFAALVYFRKEIKQLLKGVANYKYSDPETKRTLKFLMIATLISGVVGLAILNLLDLVKIQQLPLTSASINFFIGFLLILTGALQLKSRSAGHRREYHLNNTDGVVLGIMQGFAALPGLSRSGLTVSSFLFRNFDETIALRLSFIMSLPIILLGNLLLNFSDIVFMKEMFFGFLFSFIFGLGTIHMFMKFSEKVRFGHFVITFGLLAILAGIINVL
jgi:undecaprenyl-diphosphatase|tara:strand:+ start:7075 stop:7884 length:810 start_codon:yes stop_codon:yes gene_type:complete